jgi:hypothetical protein
MLLIAKKGLVAGADEDIENSPELILNTIATETFVECDLWWYKDRWWLGDYRPQYQIDNKWLEKTHQWLFIHAKNYAAVQKMSEKGTYYTWFYWNKEPLVHTNQRHLIQFEKGICQDCFLYSPEDSIKFQSTPKSEYKSKLLEYNKNLKYKGIISSYVNLLKENV